jgi:phenylacetate-CoA ligase
MRTYNYIAKNFILPASGIVFGTEVSKQLRFFEKTQWWKPKELEDYQNRKLRALIKHAYKNVPYYHNLLRSLNLYPDDIKTIDDLSELPILTKEEIRKNPEKFLAKNIKKISMIRSATSGSSGKVFEYMTDKRVLSISHALGLRAWGFAGYNIGDRLVTIAGSSLLPQEATFLKKITFKANRNLPLSSYNMDNKKVINYVHQIIKFKPKFIRGYPSSIAIIANYLLENNINEIKPLAIMTTAETLFKSDRKVISDAFDCDVFDQCGCNDGGENLCECKEHVGYHIGIERAIHEFVDNANEPVPNNEISHIILTDLWNYAMPLIRYDAGDMGIPTDEMCPCGRGLPLLKSLEGRSIDQIVLPDGKLIPGLTLTDALEMYGMADKIIEYQIIQEKVDKFTINIVKNEGYNDESSAEIHNFFVGHLGASVDVKINFLDNIPRTNANKRRIVISKVRK